MRSRALLVLLSLVLSSPMEVMAQTPTAQCMIGWEWNQNSLGQDPCLVVTMLQINCLHKPDYVLGRVGPDETYIEPRRAWARDLVCRCDTVMYSLYMACATCQGGSPYGWDSWIIQCDAILISDYSSDIPQGTAIPRWAFYNVTLLDHQLYNNSKAQSIGRDPEATPTPPKASGTPKSKGISKKTGIIICGVVGGLCFLVFTSIAAFFGLRRWRRKGEKKLQGQWDHRWGGDSRWKTVQSSPTPATHKQSFTPVRQNPSFSTGPTLVSGFAAEPYVLPKDTSDPATVTQTPTQSERTPPGS